MIPILILIPLFGSLCIMPINDYSIKNINRIKNIALITSLINFFISIILWAQFDSNTNEIQFVSEFNQLSFCHLNLGIDGLSLYFVILTTFLTPIALLSNYKNINENIKTFVISFLILETLQICLFTVLDLFLFYIFFESILPILFIVIIVYGSGKAKIRSALLFFLYTFAGMTYEVPALNLAVCWEHFLIIVESQSAGNLLDYNLLEILREYSPEIVCCNCFLILNSGYGSATLAVAGAGSGSAPLASNDENEEGRAIATPALASAKNGNLKLLTNNYKFISYLTGLIEGDGFIFVPKSERSSKGKINYPSIHIAFHLKELPLALLIQKKLGFGSLVRQKGAKAYYLIINDNKGIITMVNLLNGKMRTPKIYSLYNLINWLNMKNKDLNLIELPLCTKPLNEDAWLSGFIEAEGHFSVRTTLTGKYPKIECKFELVQSQKDPKGYEKYSFLNEVSEFLKISVKNTKINTSHPQYRLRTSNLESNLILINYLNSYPLFGSKFLDFNNWKEVFDLFRFRLIFSHVLAGAGAEPEPEPDNINKVIKLKSEMNNNRTIFNWNHLNKFYNLDY
jgi:LAGLIDADG endonuclease